MRTALAGRERIRSHTNLVIGRQRSGINRASCSNPCFASFSPSSRSFYSARPARRTSENLLSTNTCQRSVTLKAPVAIASQKPDSTGCSGPSPPVPAAHRRGNHIAQNKPPHEYLLPRFTVGGLRDVPVLRTKWAFQSKRPHHKPTRPERKNSDRNSTYGPHRCNSAWATFRPPRLQLYSAVSPDGRRGCLRECSRVERIWHRPRRVTYKKYGTV